MVAKLTYFAMMGLGEPIRLIFAATNIEFEDIRIGKEEWQKLKPTLKLPHLPMLEMDGKTIFQAIAICRYLARKNGLCGSSEDEALDIDVTVDTLEDMRKKTVVHYYQPDSEARTNGFTWADILFLSHTDYLSYLLLLDILVNFPNLKKYREKISDLPGIKEYLQKRPPHPGDCRVFFF
ncbi:hypothetical protein A483_HHAL011992 [Halyomorpha halys]|nr:hypothetical protein A483_HHAL011992 [Halyomorpha halys]